MNALKIVVVGDGADGASGPVPAPGCDRNEGPGTERDRDSDEGAQPGMLPPGTSSR
jgi:hypothetical protein